MERTMRHLLLLFLATIAFVMPALAATSPEFMLASPNYSSAPGRQSAPSLASDGTSYFAVWEDARIGEISQVIVGSRLAPDGTPLDPAGIMLTREHGGNPRVVFAGSNYLVVWQTDNGAGVARVSPEGVLLDSAAKHPIPEPSTFTGAIATNGTNTAILWQINATTHVSVLDRDGNMADDVPLPPLADDEYALRVMAAWNGSRFVIVRVIGRTCYPCPGIVARIYFLDRNGELSPGVSTPPVLYEGSLGVAALPDRILITSAAWSTGINAWIFDNTGAQIGGTIDFTWTSVTAGDPVSVTVDRGSFILAWTERFSDWRVIARRIDRDGNTPPDPTVIASSASWKANPAIAKNTHGEFLAVWTAEVPAATVESDVFARPLSASLEPDGDERIVTRSAAVEDHPSIGWNGTLGLVAWYEHQGSNGERLVVMRRARDGAAIDEAPIAAATARPSLTLHPASIASDGRDFLIVWMEDSSLFIRRLSGDGVWLDTQPALIADQVSDVTSHAAGWNGNNYFVVWTTYLTPDQRLPSGVAGISIDADGTLGSIVQISPERTETQDAVLARLGNRWLVAWTYVPPYPCDITCPNGDTDILAARVTFDGTVIDTAPIQISPQHSDAVFSDWDYARSPSVASTGETALISWIAAYGELRGLRLLSNGLIDGSPDGNGIQLLTGRTSWTRVDSAWDGRDFLILSSSATQQSDSTITLYRLPFADALRPLGNGEEISSGLATIYNNGFEGAILARPNGGALIAYPRVVFGAPYGGVSRMFARTIAARPRSSTIRR